jgi:hypothetical protein
MMGDDRLKARKRISAGVHAVIGANGDGKSLCAAHDVRWLLEEGQQVLSTCRLLDYSNPRPCADVYCEFPGHPEHGAAHPLWVPLVSFEQLMTWRDGAVFVDEVTGFADARDLGLPAQARTFLRKLRHYDIPLIWTAPDWMAADAILRRVTRAVTVSKGRWGQDHVKPCLRCAETHRKPVKGGCQGRSDVRLWPDNRVFTWKTYDATSFEQWSQAKAAAEGAGQVKRKVMCSQVYRREPNVAQHVYSTYAEVLQVAASDASGVCITCAGTRTRPQCTCADYLARRDAGKARAAARAPQPGGPVPVALEMAR